MGKTETIVGILTDDDARVDFVLDNGRGTIVRVAPSPGRTDEVMAFMTPARAHVVKARAEKAARELRDLRREEN